MLSWDIAGQRVNFLARHGLKGLIPPHKVNYRANLRALADVGVDTVLALHPMYLMRAFGGLLYLSGALLMAYNIWMTIAGHQREEAPLGGMPHDEEADRPVVSAPQAQPAE